MRILTVGRVLIGAPILATLVLAHIVLVPVACATPNDDEVRVDQLVVKNKTVSGTARKKTTVLAGANTRASSNGAGKSSQPTNSTGTVTNGGGTYTGPTYEELVAQVEDHNANELLKQEKSAGAQSVCAEGAADIPLAPCVYQPKLQELPEKPQPAKQQSNAGTAPATEPQSRAASPKITKQEVWASVKTSLSLDAATPRASPDFSVHHQRSVVTGKPLDSVVGYPLWFWAEGGDLTARTTVKKLDGMKVSLSMKPGTVTIDPGDGHPFSCAGHGTKWTPQVQPGQKSPTCGHTYAKTGTYTLSMTTHWTVHYVIDNGEGKPLVGDETVSGTKTRPMRIGELQVVVVDHA